MVCLCAVLISFSCIVLSKHLYDIFRSRNIGSNLQSHLERIVDDQNKTSRRVNVVYWNEPFPESGVSRTSRVIENGTEFTCESKMYKNAADLATADVIIFSPVLQLWPNRLETYQRDILQKLQKNKIFVFMQLESPAFHRPECYYPSCLDLKMYDNFINATSTYRIDSTYPIPYGHAISVSKRIKQMDGLQIADPLDITKRQGKSRGAVILISNCGSHRRNFLIKRLSQLVRWPNGTRALEVYGRCADAWSSLIINENTNTVLAARRYKNQEIKAELMKYKFYLSFENSQCKDYITEKFYDKALSNGVVPVVHGTKRTDYERNFPGSAFMHVDDFGSVEELAEQISYYLKPDKENEYLKFFDWYKLGESKLRVYVPKLVQTAHDWMCLDGFLARNGRLNMPAIADLQTWWYGARHTTSDSVCDLEKNPWHGT